MHNNIKNAGKDRDYCEVVIRTHVITANARWVAGVRAELKSEKCLQPIIDIL